MGNAAWIYWLCGSAAALAGFALLGWTLLSDRSRGRRGCPRCWYDMAGVPGLVCPECGNTATRERRLHRSRRKWRWAVVACISIIAGLVALAKPSVDAYGPLSLVPTSALVLLAPSVPESRITSGSQPSILLEEMHDQLLLELAARAEAGMLLDWHWRRFLLRKQVVHAWKDAEDAAVVHVRLDDPWFMSDVGQFQVRTGEGPAFAVTAGPDPNLLAWLKEPQSPRMQPGGALWPLLQIPHPHGDARRILLQVSYRLFVDVDPAGHFVLDHPVVLWSGEIEVTIQDRDPHEW